ncbi:ABC transporter permease [Thermus filiformis]|uniref:Iron ABC transporter permease n=1 Tax=Thermus filiformis TaxID=276 RepID=A0A0A2WM45_THEFI|nr:iron ABC transporter permease [Thermus filiformis]KGQ21231.1 iron ABC transporter permease [Thermus filiformis]
MVLSRPLPPWPFLLPALLTGGGVVLPLVYLVVRALEARPEVLLNLLLRPKTLGLFANTLALLLFVLLLTTLLALPLAWLTTRTDLKGKRFLALLLALPLAVPGYVGAYALLAATGPGGLLPLPRPEGFWGAGLVLALFTYPYLFLNLRAAFLGLDPGQEEAARTLGHGPFSVFLRVTLPQLFPAFLSGWMVVGLHVLGDFGVVSLLRYETFSYAIYLQYSAAFDRTYAAALALFLLLLTGGVLGLEALLLRRYVGGRVGRGSARAAQPAPLGRLRPLAYGLLLLPPLLALGFPLYTLFHLALRFPGSGLSEVGLAFAHSALASSLAAALVVAMALPLAYTGVRFPSFWSRLLERVAYLGYATPPLAYALAWIFLSLRLFPFLYQTLPLLVLAYSFHLLAEGLGPIRAALYQVPPRLEEAARTLGRTPVQAFFQVTFPLLWRGAAAGGALVFMAGMKELPLTLLLAPLGYTTLATRVFGYTQEAMFAEAAPFALLLVLLSAAFVGVLLWSEKR